MRKILFTLFLACWGMHAQAQFNEKQSDSNYRNFRPIIPVEKATLLKNMSMIANMQFGFRNNFENGKYDASKFAMNQFRLEIRGKVHDRVSFRFRDRYTRDPITQSVDNISRSVDIASVGVQLDKDNKWNLALGKLCADWGGFEFDYNPILIYEYNDIVEFADNFLTGAQISYQVDKKNSFTFQILNSRTKTFQELYGVVPGVTEASFPSAAVLNWRGSLFGGKLNTLWSYSIFQEAKKKNMYYLALGNELNLKPLTITYDFKYSYEQLDRKTIVSTMIPDSFFPYAASDVSYLEHWLKFDYQASPRLVLSLTAFSSVARWNGNKNIVPRTENKLRTSYGIVPVIELSPFKDLNMKFFLNYIGRFYRHTDYAKTVLNNQDYNRSSINVGFISPLRVF